VCDHIKEFESINASLASLAASIAEQGLILARIDERLLTQANMTGDHENRLRKLENTWIDQVEVNKTHEDFDNRITRANDNLTALTQTIEAFKKVTWAIGLAVATGIIGMLLEIFR
jgi:hypothetical protein